MSKNMQQKCNLEAIERNRNVHKTNAHGRRRVPSKVSVTKVNNSTQDKMAQAINNIRNDSPRMFNLNNKSIIGSKRRRSICDDKNSFTLVPPLDNISKLLISSILSVKPCRIFSLLLLLIVMSGKKNTLLLVNIQY